MILVDPEFQNLIPSLNEKEQDWLEGNNLGFKGWDENYEKFIEILPSVVGNVYWFVCVSYSRIGFQEYTKRPIALSRLLSIELLRDVSQHSLKPCFCTPLPIDHFDDHKISKEKTKLTNIYFIQSVKGGPIKIGKADNIEHRLKQIQNLNPFKLKIIKTLNGVPFQFEKVLHKKYRKYHLHGEWFSEEVCSLLN